jgi:hypothetical protein
MVMRRIIEEPPDVEGRTAWQRFKEFTRRIMIVPKAEIDRREAAHQKRRRRSRRAT